MDCARKTKSLVPRPKAKRFKRFALHESLAKWRHRVRRSEFVGSMLTQGGDYEVFMPESLMKSISRDASTAKKLEACGKPLSNGPREG